MEEEQNQKKHGFDVRDPDISSQLDDLVASFKSYAQSDLLREVLVAGVKLAVDGASRGDMKILRAAVKEMRHAFRIFAEYREVPKVAVFGSARTRPEEDVYRLAVELGQRLVQSGYLVITGAGEGVMGAAHLGAGRRSAVGLNILLPFEQLANPVIAGDPKLINFRYFFTRKLFFVKESDAIVLLPGGFGTLDEGFEVLTLLQTGKCPPLPVVMLDDPASGYWENWNRFVRQDLLARGLISEEDLSLFKIAHDVEEVCQEIGRFYRRYHSSRFVDRRNLLMLRLRTPIPPGLLEKLNRDFSDICRDGQIEESKAHPDEKDERETLDLVRMKLPFDQFHYGRLRRLIDAINDF